MDIGAAVANVRRDRKAILFLGAGFSNDATNIAGGPTPSSKQLSKTILDRYSISDTAPLSLAIDQMREREPPTEAFNFLRQQLTVSKLTEVQEEILGLPWARIYTTNIDNIGSELSKRHYRDAVVDQPPVSTGDFIYLHGCIGNCGPTNYYSRLKMGEQLYVAGSHSNSPLHHVMRQDFYEADVVIVIGYSMADPDLQTLFFESPDLVNKCFVFSGTPDALSSHRIKLIGHNTNRTAAQFLEAARAVPPGLDLGYSSAITEDNGSYEYKETSQGARQNLLVLGRFDRNIARTSWNVPGSQPYVVGRSAAASIAEIKAPRIVVIHSHLGNGKSLLLENLRYLLSRAGKSSFIIDSSADRDRLRAALSEIPTSSNVIFEGDVFSVGDMQDVVRERSLVLIATSRTTTYRVALQRLNDLARGILTIVDANRLFQADLEAFHDLIDSMGFWPQDLARLDRARRLVQLEKAFDLSICAIVLKIFENAKVQDAIASAWNSSTGKLRNIYDHFIVRSYMQMIDIEVPGYFINEFQAVDYSITKQAEDDLVKVDFDGGVHFGNAIVAEHVFRKHIRSEDTIGAIVRFVNFISQHPSYGRYSWVIRRLLRFRNLNRILGGHKQPLEVFDRCSYIPQVASDPLFWVQYSIVEMENENFLAAERFVTTAYERAKDRGKNFDPYQIDTHSARLTIRKLTARGVYDGFGKDVVASVNKLRAVIGRRADDVYHVSSVVVQILEADFPWTYHLKDADYRVFRATLGEIGRLIHTAVGDELAFDVERRAMTLIAEKFPA